jgi:transposase
MVRFVDHLNEGTLHMIVIGADTHKRNHTLVAVDGQTGAARGQIEIPASEPGALEALRFAIELDEERVWAIEDCRHVSARLERALMSAGEHVIRVPATMTGQVRKVSRQAGKSDPIDARAVALAAVRDGVESFPEAFLDDAAMEIRVLNDYRDQIIWERTRLINQLRWHLVAIAPDIEAQLSPAALRGPRICARLTRQLARLPQSPWLRVARATLKRITAIVAEERELLHELSALLQAHTPQLALTGCGPVTAATSSATPPVLPASRPTGISPVTPAPPLSPRQAARLSATDCIAAGTASSTAPCTSSRSPAPKPIPKPASTSTAKSQKARPSSKPSAASNATSPAASGGCSTPPRPQSPRRG